MYDDTNKKVLGKMKLETSDKVVVEFVGLRSKLHSLLLDNGDEKKTCKGIKECVKNNKIRHQNYKDTLIRVVEKEVLVGEELGWVVEEEKRQVGTLLI